jgi:hypothetical protein
MTEVIIRNGREQLLHADRALKGARSRGGKLAPTALPNLVALEKVIDQERGIPEKKRHWRSIFGVVDRTVLLVSHAGKTAAKFRGKLFEHLTRTNGDREVMARLEDVGRRIAWASDKDRARKDPFNALSMLLGKSALLSVLVTELGQKNGWQNGYLRWRAEAGRTRLAVVKDARDAIVRIHAFRSANKSRPNETWDKVVAEKGDLREGLLMQALVRFEDALNFIQHSSQEQQKIVDCIIAGETLLMGFESMLLDALDPDAKVEETYAREVTRKRVDWSRLDGQIERTGQPVGSGTRKSDAA